MGIPQETNEHDVFQLYKNETKMVFHFKRRSETRFHVSDTSFINTRTHRNPSTIFSKTIDELYEMKRCLDVVEFSLFTSSTHKIESDLNLVPTKVCRSCGLQ